MWHLYLRKPRLADHSSDTHACHGDQRAKHGNDKKMLALPIGKQECRGAEIEDRNRELDRWRLRPQLEELCRSGALTWRCVHPMD